MYYDKWILGETILNCKHQDLENYMIQVYVEMVKHELNLFKIDYVYGIDWASVSKY